MLSKIGIMGGTFNPIHNGHIKLALEAYKQFDLDKVWVMISKTPPHKDGNEIIDINARANMVQLAIEAYKELEFSDFEMKREGYIYTADTLLLLKNEYPDFEFYFIMGGDSIKNIEKWYKPEIVMKNAIILAAIRDDMDTHSILNQIKYLKDKYSADIRELKISPINISSTDIRKRVKNQEDISQMVPKAVEDYITKEKLYG